MTWTSLWQDDSLTAHSVQLQSDGLLCCPLLKQSPVRLCNKVARICWAVWRELGLQSRSSHYHIQQMTSQILRVSIRSIACNLYPFFQPPHQSTGVPDRQTFLTNVARISTCLWLFHCPCRFCMIKQTSGALLWDRIINMKTYRLSTIHRSLFPSHLHDTPFMRSVLLYVVCLRLIK